MRTVWLRSDVLTWERGSFGTALPISEDIRRPYQYLAHAELLLDGTPSELHRADAIANTKRALNQRLQVLDKRYKISRIPMQPPLKGLLQRLEALGVVRPLVLRQLLDVRNRIEHRDSPPPAMRRCRELIDFVWYFLRSTDILANSVYTSGPFTCFTPNGDETPYVFDLDVTFASQGPRIRVSGWFPSDALQEHDTEGFLRVRASALSGPEALHAKQEHLDKLLTDRWLIGSVLLAPGQHLQIFRTLLNIT